MDQLHHVDAPFTDLDFTDLGMRLFQARGQFQLGKRSRKALLHEQLHHRLIIREIE
jgi:hypothetical protein